MSITIHNLRADLKKDPIGLDALPALSWELRSDKSEVKQLACQVQSAVSLSDLREEKNLQWDSGKFKSDRSVFVEYGGPKPLKGQQIYWRTRCWDNHGNLSPWSEPATWQMGISSEQEWEADWIETGVPEDTSDSSPCPYLRKEFSVPGEVEAATVYVSAHGLFELSINGARVGEDVFSPGWTSYHHHLQYYAYDVSDQLTPGVNALGVILGDGWYRGYLGWQGKRNTYGEKTAVLLQLEISYKDGQKDVICSDRTWKSATGPILSSEIYHGETYDARKEINGWDRSGFNDSSWAPVVEKDHPKSIIHSLSGVPVRKLEAIQPLKKFTTPKGEVVFDLGVNIVGWIRFRLKGDRGSRIVLHHAEVLDSEGNFYITNLRDARAEDVYIFRGEGIETYEPRFTFHGFRYIRISEFAGDVKLDDLEGIVVSSGVERTGSFECSDPLVNQLQENIVRGLYGNFLDVPTDCPQRDERLGWTGDAQVFAPTACYNVNAWHFYRKWMKDVAHDQREDGSVPWVVPNVVVDGGGTGWSDGFGATGWADAAIVIPWVVYLSYGDKKILEDQYASMLQWEEYMIREAGDTFIFSSGFHFGDWLSFAEYYSYFYNAPDYGYAGAHTSKELIATAYFHYSTGIMKEVAGILGKNSDHDRFENLQQQIGEAFRNEFITAGGRMVSETQTAYAMALEFGLLLENQQQGIARRLADDVNHFGHLTTGFLGTPILSKALSDNGYPEIAMKLLMNKRYPSWLYPVTMGATTIWERWDGIKPDGTFQDEGMNSFNHYAYGAIGNWLYTTVAGINPVSENPGYKKIRFAAIFPREFEYVKARFNSVYGEIRSEWQYQGNELTWEVAIPCNCNAEMELPGSDINDIKIWDREGKEFIPGSIQEQEGKIFVELGSGVWKTKLSVG